MSSTEVKTYRQKERKQGLVDINKDSCMKQWQQNKRRRLFQERTTHEVYYNSFFPRTIRDWDQLPLQVISANSLEEFRAGLAISPALHWSSACSLFVNSFNLYIATWGASFPVHHAQTLLNQFDRVWLNVCTAPHHTAPGKIQYRTDGKSPTLPSNFVPDQSINLIWYFMFEVGKLAGRIGEIVAYMYQWDRIPYDTYCGG